MRPLSKGSVFVLAAVAAAAFTGGVLGAAGSLVPERVRPALGVVAAVAAVGLGTAVLFGRSWSLPQLDVETPLRWAHDHPLRWAAKNGAALGFAGGTRIGFPLFYAVPISSLLSGDVVIGAMLYGTYGLTRGLIPVGVALATRRRNDSRRVVESFLAARPRVARHAAAVLVLEAAAVAAAML